MKKFIAVILVICFLGICAIIYRTHFTTKVEKINIDSEQVGYIRLKSRRAECEIVNKEIISEIVNNINLVEIKDEKNIAFAASEPKDYLIYLYSNVEDRRLVKSIRIASDKVITIDDKAYEINNDVELYEYFEDIMSFCGKSLPKETEKNISSLECVGLENIEKAEMIDEYNNMLDAKPIKEEEAELVDKYIVFKTLDEDEITIYCGEDLVCIKYEYGDESSGEERKIVYFEKR